MKTYKIDDKEYNMITSIYEFKQFVTEGLIITHDIDTTINFVKDNRIFNKNMAYIREIIGKNKIEINIWKFIPIDLIILLNNELINLYGWYPGFCIFNYYDRNKKIQTHKGDLDFDLIIENENGFDSLIIYYEAKFDYIQKFDNDTKLYHISPQLYRDKILKQGLIPKSKNRRSIHPERIYFMKDDKYTSTLLKNLKLTDKNKATKYKNIIDKIFMNDDDTFKYDLYEISNLNKYTFYTDPNYGNGVYSIENINPKDIKLIKQN